MTYDWYYIFNLTEFEALDLVSRMYTPILENLGQKEILVTKGNYTSILYDDVFLPINLNDRNPFAMGDYAVYLDSDSQNVFLGIVHED